MSSTVRPWLDDNKTILASHSIDDRVGCAVLVELARKLARPPKHDIYFVGSVQEEIGCFGVRHFLRKVTPDWFIALDTGFAQDAVPDIQRTVPMDTGLGVRRLAFAQPSTPYPATVNFASPRKTILASHSIDDRVGCAVLVELSRRLKKPPRHDIYFVGAVQEEIGCFGVRHFLRKVTPDWFIALDTGFAQDAVPDIQRTVPMDTGLGVRRLAFAQPSTPYPATVNFASPRLNQLLIDAARKKDIPFHVDVSTGIFSDHNSAYEVNPDIESTFMFVAARRYSHSPTEVADLSNAERAVDVLHQAIADMDSWDE